MRSSIPSGAQNVIQGIKANIRFVNDSTPVLAPYKTVRLVDSRRLEAGWTYDLSFMNAKLTGSAFVNPSILYHNIMVYSHVHDGTFALPVTPNEVRLSCIRSALHECGHMFGLVAENFVLDGVMNNHNPPPTGFRIMDVVPKDGYYEIRFGRAGSWTWRKINVEYLQFVFPKE